MSISTITRFIKTNSMLVRVSYSTCLVLLGTGFMGGSIAHGQKIDTIALYEFAEESNLFLDSSGNNYNMNGGTGVTQSTTEYSPAAPTQTSAFFNGSQTYASRLMNLHDYTAITFDWYMKTDGILTGSSRGTLFTSSWDSS